ncbi:hypothetical protein OH76DRAFT_864114 [Lentinus brumalis]|uniref:Uncharacterized protein n=1 Tax=Lentinus brumalis TaxID=2498619 RepID=A0A371DR98_9APHY|nr:hypothetical protein OH76DRAFT_864114 [Polyporus brumalis]
MSQLGRRARGLRVPVHTGLWSRDDRDLNHSPPRCETSVDDLASPSDNAAVAAFYYVARGFASLFSGRREHRNPQKCCLSQLDMAIRNGAARGGPSETRAITRWQMPMVGIARRHGGPHWSGDLVKFCLECRARVPFSPGRHDGTYLLGRDGRDWRGDKVCM